QGQHDVLAHGEVGDDAVGLALLRAIAEAETHGVARRMQPRRSSLDARRAAVGAIGPEHQPRRLGPARAEQAGKADDLAMAQIEIERCDAAGLAELLEARTRLALYFSLRLVMRGTFMR